MSCLLERQPLPICLPIGISASVFSPFAYLSSTSCVLMSFLMWIRQIVMNERKLLPGSFHGKATRLWPAQSGKVTQSGMHSYFCENVGEKDFACHVALVSCRVIDKKPHYYWPYSPAYNSNALHSMKTVPYYYNFIPPTPLFYSYIWFRMYNMYNCINLYVYTGPGATQVERDKSAFLRRGSSQWRANTCLLVQMCRLCTCRLQECILFPKF